MLLLWSCTILHLRLRCTLRALRASQNHLVETVLSEEKEVNLPQTTPTYTGHYHDPHLTINFEGETAQLDSTPMKLTAKSFTLLAFLARHAGQLVPRETLLLLVWGYREGVRTRTLDVHIRLLRKSLGKYGNAYIETIFGVGYRFQPSRAQAIFGSAAETSFVTIAAARGPGGASLIMSGL